MDIDNTSLNIIDNAIKIIEPEQIINDSNKTIEPEQVINDSNKTIDSEEIINQENIKDSVKSDNRKKNEVIKPDHNKKNNSKAKHLKITKINEFIYLGSCEHPLTNSDEFQKLNIDVVINCAAEVEYPADTPFHVENFKIIDGEAVSFLENMDQAINKIRMHLSKRKKIYLHCLRGISRSPAILIYLLMSHKKYTYDTAYNLVRKKRRIVSINEEFESCMRTIED